MRSRPPIRDFSDAELHAQIARRQALRRDGRPEHWCDECDNFELGGLCRLKHAMRFFVPIDYSVEWGHYRRDCRDRQAADAREPAEGTHRPVEASPINPSTTADEHDAS